MKNIIKNRNFCLPKKLYKMWKKYWGQSYSSQEDIKIHLKALFDRTPNFRFSCKINVIKIKTSILHQIYVRYEKNLNEENCSFQKDLQISF